MHQSTKNRLIAAPLRLVLAGCVLHATASAQSLEQLLADPGYPVRFLSGPRTGEPLQIALDYLRETRGRLRLTDEDLGQIVVKSHSTTRHNRTTHVYLRQTLDGLEVANADLNVSVDSDGRVINLGGNPVPRLREAVRTDEPSLSAQEAVAKAAASVGASVTKPLELRRTAGGPAREVRFSDGGVSLEDIPAKLQYFAVSEQEVRLAWNVVLRATDHRHWWSLEVDAVTGEVLDRADWIADETYQVVAFPKLNPEDGPRASETNRADSQASPFGWHDTNGAAGAEFTTTRGNNVTAQEDVDANDLQGFRPDGGAGLSFSFPFNPAADPSDYQSAAITNLFYWNNVLHDLHWKYGFDEAAGNFQSNNYGRGGFALDEVQADAQDGSDVNNANFGTPPDGLQPRMQMFRWQYPFANLLTVNSPPGIAGDYAATSSAFGPQPSAAGLTRNLVLARDAANAAGPSNTDACSALTNAAAVNGKIALVDRGSCDFTVKVANAQAAGAAAVVVVNNVPSPPVALGGTDTSIDIPAVMISQAHGAAIKAELTGTVNGTLKSAGTALPKDRDSDFDSGVIVHEYGHGVSNRLTGGPLNSSCLQQNQSRGMGEGWSDFWALALTASATQTGPTRRGVGTYVTWEATDGYGIRPYPYSTDLAVNPQTFEDVRTAAIPHGIGAIWAQMLWEVYWGLVAQHGYSPDLYNASRPEGNIVALRLVMDALKLQPCNPTIVQARDALLLADMNDNAGANQCLIWRGFAKRGLGVNASSGTGPADVNVVEDFTVPSACGGATPTPTATRTATPAASATRTPSAQATSTPSPTPTPRPAGTPTPTTTPSDGVRVLDDRVQTGTAIQVDGVLPSGVYTLCVVPNFEFAAGQRYTGPTAQCIPAFVGDDGRLPPTTVWASSRAGSYDVLAFDQGASPGTIAAGDDPSSQAGVVVADMTVGSGGAAPLVLGLLLLVWATRRQAHPWKSRA